MSEILGNNPENQNNGLSEREYFSNIEKYKQYYKDNSEAQELVKKQDIEYRNLQEKKDSEKQEIIQGTKKEKETKNLQNEVGGVETSEIKDISSTEAEKYIELGEKEALELEQKQFKINLIKEVAGMYKDYLQDILQNIKFKVLTSKDERYETQIGIMQSELEYLENLTKYLDFLGNYDELKNLNLNELLDKIIVSEEKIAKTGFMFQLKEGMLNKKFSVDGVNKGYEEIKKLLLSENLTLEKVKKIKLKIFSQIREYDSHGLDDNTPWLNSGEAISQRVIEDVLENKDLRSEKDIDFTFDSLQNFSVEEKQKLFNALKGGKENFINSLYGSKVLSKLKFKKWKRYNSNVDEEKSFLINLFDNLNKNLNTINDEKIKEELEKKVENEFTYLLKRIPDEKKEEVLEKKQEALKPESISKLIESLKVETTFAIFEKSVINKTIEKNSGFAYKVAKAENNTEVKLYTNIEGNLNRLGDKLSNNIKYTINFLTEQIAIMFVSGLMGNVALRGLNATKFATLGANGSKLGKIASFTGKAGGEGTGFYGTYTLLNGVVNEKELNDIFKNYNGYDWLKTIAFLGILRSLPLEKLRNKYNIENSKFLNEIKNITIDTAAVLGTDITIKGFESLGNNILGNKNGNENINRSYGEYLVEELSYIVPLVIGLRQADKAVARMFEGGKKPETTVNIKGNDLIIMFKIGELRTEIRVLKEYRNILRNKGKSTKEINKKITEKKKEKKEEYKKVRDNNQVEQEQLEQPKQTNQEKNKPIQPKKSEKNNVDKAKENVNTDSGTKEMTGKIIQNVLKGNIEDVMKGFGRNGSISEEFQKLLKSGNKEQVRELVGKEVDLEVQKLKSEGVKIDESGKKFIEEFKEQRVAEFEKIVEIKREQKDIPSEIKMSFKGKEWDLKLKDLEGLNKWFEQWIKRNNLIQEDENNRIKNKKT